ncbi:DUF2280 domain-containing protein [Novosphingobium sp. FKTRR1]|uniref:DUF2280 domain-containing protein n=1 Tax=Novosphingobium sp. FKTRR1 TaxID=2879118 RepID=UPI001CF077FC
MTLNDKQKTWLVMRYACYGRLAEVLREFKEEFGVEIPSYQARAYDLSVIRDTDHARSRGVEKWMPLWTRTREEFEASVKNIAIASATYRIAKLDEMFAIAFAKRNYKSAAQLLEQAAKETGGAFSGKRTIEGTVDHNHNHAYDDVPDDVKRVTMAARVREAVAEALAAASPTAH